MGAFPLPPLGWGACQASIAFFTQFVKEHAQWPAAPVTVKVIEGVEPLHVIESNGAYGNARIKIFTLGGALCLIRDQLAERKERGRCCTM